MTGNVYRSIAAVTLAGLMALAPVAPVYGQNSGSAPAQPQVIAQNANPAPQQQPAPAANAPASSPIRNVLLLGPSISQTLHASLR